MERDQTTPLPKIGPWQLVYENAYEQVHHVDADFGSFTKEYFVTERGQRAGVVVVKEGAVLLVRQYRLLINGISWEVPGGRVDEGETPEEAAIRECAEETGVRCHSLRPLLSFHTGLETLHNPTHLFTAEDFEESQDRHYSTTEVEGHAWVTLERCIDMVFQGQILDSFSIVALLAYQASRGRQTV